MTFTLVKKAYVNAYMQDTASGNETLTEAIEPYIENLQSGWVGTGNGVWTPETPALCYSDMYEVVGEQKYFLTLGDTVGTRFRVMFSTIDVSTATQKVSGIAVNTQNYNDPSPNQNLYYTPPSDGFIIVQKDNAGNSNIKTYLYGVVSNDITCCFVGSVNPDTFDANKMLQIIAKLTPCLDSSLQVVAVKKVEGYKIILSSSAEE